MPERSREEGVEISDPDFVRAELAADAHNLKKPVCDALDCGGDAAYKGWLGKSGASVYLCGFHLTKFARLGLLRMTSSICPILDVEEIK